MRTVDIAYVLGFRSDELDIPQLLRGAVVDWLQRRDSFRFTGWTLREGCHSALLDSIAGSHIEIYIEGHYVKAVATAHCGQQFIGDFDPAAGWSLRQI